ncbi:MAG: NAD(P)/FAD-dependent oxidoreductase [Chlamydiota bacterium]
MPTNTHTAIIIGSGFSGLAMAIKLKERGIHDFIVLEKAAALGGTWRENTYPGAECDIPSALYSYSFEPYPYWEYKWSMQPQILAYMKHVADKYDLLRHIHFEKEMTSAQWMDAESHWAVETRAGDTYRSRSLISAIGQLHHPREPDVKGKDLFEGMHWHSARWRHDVALKDKVIGVIGNAASAVQFIPEIAKTAKKVVVFQRTANWMLPKQDRAYKNWEKKLVVRFPFLLKFYRFKIWMLTGFFFFLMKDKNHLLRKFYQRKSINYVKKHIKDPDLVNALTPTYPLGAKRVLFSDTYYQALAQPNVQLVPGGIKEIRTWSVVGNDDSEHEVDVLIYATGFITNPFLLRLDIRGEDQLSIQDHWQQGPKTYLGMAVDRFPNLFIMYGPNTNIGHTSYLLVGEAQANYIAQCIQGLKDNGWSSMSVKPAVLNENYNHNQEKLKRMIWAKVDKSWYRSKNGDIANNYPDRIMKYQRKTRRVNFDDYDISTAASNQSR